MMLKGSVKLPARCLYKNHLEEEVKRWIPNESYVDMKEAQGEIKMDFIAMCR